MNLETRVAAFARIRMRELLESPDAWGRPDELERQVLLLVEVLLVAASENNLDTVACLNDRYLAYLNRTVGGQKNAILAIRLQLGNHTSECFTEVLRNFVATMVGAQVTPAVPISHRATDRSPDLVAQ